MKEGTDVTFVRKAHARLDRALVLAHKALRSLRARGVMATLARTRQKLRPLPVPPEYELWMPPVQVSALVVPVSRSPSVSIVIPVYNHWDSTERCLRALTAAPPGAEVEVIVVDDGSADETPRVAPEVEGLRYIRRPQNGGFIAACTDGADAAEGDHLVFLNNDTVPQPGWLGAMLRTLAEDDDVGLVGAQLVDMRGRVQEAGGIVFSDGGAANYGRGFLPGDPRVSYRRSVDYCSGAALLLRRDVYRRAGGFDDRFRPAYYEDTDLAFAVRGLGLDVVYSPWARVAHDEGTTSGTDTRHGVKAYQVRNQRVFADKWASTLRSQPAPGTPLGVAATHRARAHVLVVDGETPRPDMDSGSVRLLNLMRLLLEDGAHVAFWPIDRRFDAVGSRLLQEMGVETQYAPFATSLAGYLREVGDHLDTIIACRYNVAREVLPVARRLAPQAKFVFDTVDLHYLRERRQARITGDVALRKLAETTRRIELDTIRRSDVTLVVSETERALLAQEISGGPIEVLSNIHQVRPDAPGFDDREGILFVGGFRHLPNADAMRWFLGEVLPRIRDELPEVQFHCVGAGPPDDILAHAAPPYTLIHGHVPDLAPYVDRCRLSVAPLRFGAGVKGKINMSLAHRQPVVATTLAVEGMFLTPGVDVLVADDADSFARSVVRLYRDRELWALLSAEGLHNVQSHFSADAAGEVIRRVLLNQ